MRVGDLSTPGFSGNKLQPHLLSQLFALGNPVDERMEQILIVVVWNRANLHLAGGELISPRATPHRAQKLECLRGGDAVLPYQEKFELYPNVSGELFSKPEAKEERNHSNQEF
jgi:hypothetical protein